MVARVQERVRGALGHRSVVSIEVERGDRGQLEVVGRPRPVAGLGQPVGDQLVQPHALALRKARVRDLLQRRVPDAPASHGAGVVLGDEDLGLLELPDLVAGGLGIDRPQLVHVERDEERRRAPGELAQAGVEVVEPRRDDGLHGGREARARGGCPGVGAVGEQHAGRLDDEERVAAGAVGDLGRFGVLDPAAGRLPGEVEGLVGAQRLETESNGVGGRRAPRRAFVEQARAREREDERLALTAAGR